MFFLPSLQHNRRTPAPRLCLDRISSHAPIVLSEPDLSSLFLSLFLASFLYFSRSLSLFLYHPGRNEREQHRSHFSSRIRQRRSVYYRFVQLHFHYIQSSIDHDSSPSFPIHWCRGCHRCGGTGYHWCINGLLVSYRSQHAFR